MKGRKPYPFSIVQANNDKDHRTKEQLQGRLKNQPSGISTILRCPTHLSAEAKKEWRRITKLYGELTDPIINAMDQNALEIYCEAVVTYQKAMAKVRETAEVYASKQDNNRPKKNPWLTVANEAADQIKKYSEILLLDPVSRARVGLAKANEEDPDTKRMSELLARRQARKDANVP